MIAWIPLMIIIQGRMMYEVSQQRIEFTVIVYEDAAGERTYMATTAGSMKVGIGETPYDAIRDLCEKLDAVEGSE